MWIRRITGSSLTGLVNGEDESGGAQPTKWYEATWRNARRAGAQNGPRWEYEWQDSEVNRVRIVLEGIATSSTWTGEAVSALAV